MMSCVMCVSGWLLLVVVILFGLFGCVVLLVCGGKCLYQVVIKLMVSVLVVVVGLVLFFVVVCVVFEQVVCLGVFGVMVIVMCDGQWLFCFDFGKIVFDVELLVVFVFKWMIVVLVMSVVDEGCFVLDVLILCYLLDFIGEVGCIILCELLVQMVGIGSLCDGVDICQDLCVMFVEFVVEVVYCLLQDLFGIVFCYGGLGFQVVGVVVEVVIGRCWVDLFDECIVCLLGMYYICWEYLFVYGVLFQQMCNLLLQGGVVIMVDDYMCFFIMLVQYGCYGDWQIFFVQVVDVMEKVQMLGMLMVYCLFGVCDGVM